MAHNTPTEDLPSGEREDPLLRPTVRAPEVVRGKNFTFLEMPSNLSHEHWRPYLEQLAKEPGVKVCFAPGVAISAPQFMETFPVPSIAGDSSVKGGSFKSYKHANFDHHEDTAEEKREGQHAMCALVIHAAYVKFKMKDFFTPQGNYEGIVFINHIDGDNGLAAAALALAGEVVDPEETRKLAKLAWMESRMDAYAGCFRFEDRSDACALKAWVNPVSQARKKNGWLLEKMTPEEKLELLEQLRLNTLHYLEGSLEELPLDEGHRILKNFEKWMFVEEFGPDARYAIAAHEKPFISYRGTNAQGRHLYSSISCVPTKKRNVRVLNSHKLFDNLNCIELANAQELATMQYPALMRKYGKKTNPKGPWGGNGVGGSFLNGGSKIPPDKFPSLANYLIEQLEVEEVAAHMQVETSSAMKKLITSPNSSAQPLRNSLVTKPPSSGRRRRELE